MYRPWLYGDSKDPSKQRNPRKAGKHHPLSDKDKAYNKRLARKRIIIEHINARIKTF